MTEISNQGSPSQGHHLNRLLKPVEKDVNVIYGHTDIEISSVEYNSKKVGRNSLFVAVPGFARDGHDFIKDAVGKGAAAIIVSKERAGDFAGLSDNGIAVVAVEDPRRSLSAVSASFYDHPTSRVPVIGITGTNGKTSITYLIESVLRENRLSPGVVGTINYRWKDTTIDAPNTTPESRDLQEIFAKMVFDGVEVIIMEVSSHALKLFRVEDIDFNIAVFTNLTRDHMDFHESFDDYFHSKRKIFHLLERSGKDNKAAIVNIDDEYGRKIFSGKTSFTYPVLGIGMSSDADFKPLENSIVSSLKGISYVLEKPEAGLKIDLNILGDFQIYNSLCAFASCYKLGIPSDTIRKGLYSLKAIPGRFDAIKTNSGFNVIIDYAHTDDAVSKLLSSARELKPARIITVIGCGGNRDKTKRPIMGKTSVLNSDWVIFTSDNPRDEEPGDIINDIVSGLSESNFEIITDRENAIRKAVFMAQKNDLLVIAGKGHENYQIVKGKKSHFDDHEIAGKYITERERLC